MFHIDKFLEMRENKQMSFREIGSAMTVKPATVHAALKRYAQRGQHCDLREFNGRKNPRHKITAELSRKLLDRTLL